MGESNVKGISVRAIIAVFLVLTTCVLCGFKIEVPEPLKTLVIMVVSFYFAQQFQPQNPKV